MLLIPIIGKISWRNPPAITLGLILINCIIYFGFQLGEDQAYYDLQAHYYESGLLKIEAPRYLAYVDREIFSQAYSEKFSRLKKKHKAPSRQSCLGIPCSRRNSIMMRLSFPKTRLMKNGKACAQII